MELEFSPILFSDSSTNNDNCSHDTLIKLINKFKISSNFLFSYNFVSSIPRIYKYRKIGQ